jgi:hypothetical protein
MRTTLLLVFFLLALLLSCNTSTNKNTLEKTAAVNDFVQHDSSKTNYPTEELSNNNPQNISPVFGYRFTISGDFDGDGKKEKLTEHYFSGLDNKETNKFYHGLTDYNQLVELTIAKKPYSFLTSDNELIDTLQISSDNQLLGLSFLKNEGDLNGDGTDEISYVIHWADWSFFNRCHLVTYKNKVWTEIYSFHIRDWQLPDLPETFNQNGIFGIEQKIINTTNDTVNERLEKELLNFKGLIKKISTNKIQVYCVDDETFEDTIIVDLNNLNK